MGPRYDVRYTTVKAGKKILVAVMCFLFTEIPSLITQLQEADLGNKLFRWIVSHGEERLCLQCKVEGALTCREHLEIGLEKPLPSHKYQDLLLLPV